MKNITFFIIIAAAVSLLSCTPPQNETAEPKSQTEAASAAAGDAAQETATKNTGEISELKDFSERLSYVLGLDIGSSLVQTPSEINFDILQKGLLDSYHGKEALMTQEEVNTFKKEFAAKSREEFNKITKERAEKNIKEGKVFLAENKTKEGVVTTASGLQYKVIKEGDGPVPSENDRVKVHYSGTLLDGTEFDSSYKRNEPAVFPLKNVIPGWTEALQLMKVGSKYKLFIPSELAYKERAVGQVIGPNATLVFEVELLGIEE